MNKFKNCDELKFWLGKNVNVVIDREIGTIHPKWKNIKYKVNYGFIPNTIAGDGHPIDVYILGEKRPLSRLEVKIVACVIRYDDVEIKLVGSRISQEFTPELIMNSIEFVEKYFHITICTQNRSLSYKYGKREI